MPKNIDDETREILVSFVSEGYERLDDSEAQLSNLNQDDSTSSLNSIFRLFHSVKGSAGYLGFDNIKQLTHEAETLLDVFLKEKRAVTQDAIDVIYSTIDVLRSLIGIVETEYTDETGKDAAREQTAIVSKMIATLRGGGGESAGPPSAPKAVESANASPNAPSSASKVSAPEAEPKATETAPVTDASASSANNAPGAATPVERENGRDKPQPTATTPRNEIAISELVTHDMVLRFTGECADLADKAERRLLAMDPTKPDSEAINEIFRAVHTIKGNSGFFGYAYLERKCMELEGILDAARKRAQAPGEAFINGVIIAVDNIRTSLATVAIVDADKADKASASDQDRLPVDGDAANALVPTAPETPEKKTDAAYKPLGEILIDMGVVQDESIREALDEQERPLGEILVQKGIVEKERIDEALKIQKTQVSTGGAELPHEIVRKEIRVDTAKLDKLFELVGELITAESMVVNSPDLKGMPLDHFTKAASSLAKISREIQETTMMIRMIPLDGLFQKMTRLVRDLSRKMDRPINFTVSGQDTEMDKNVIEQISDPLVHILRNAIDHGIEPREKRLAAGKAETGSVTMNAKYEGSEIWISVRDDGAGLNREKILAKAASKGMLKAPPESLRDEDVWAFIFEPGFSTAEVVSDVSGRGVGLDVVKKNLEHIRGRIQIQTNPGEGTEFTLAIPLTMAIIDGITVRVGDNRYSLPLGDIIEFCKVSPTQVTSTDRPNDTINIRTEFLPLIMLAEVFAVPNAVTNVFEGIVIIVHNNGRKACLLIDEVIGNQQIVVKSLSEYLGKVEGISGCSILGDGGVSFIIDTGKLLSMRLE
jgi:two-component system chemotaxis sensor kinase CheA